MSRDRQVPPQQGDEYELFQRYEQPLRQATRKLVAVSEANIEDGCAYAWMRFLLYQPRRETALPWLVTVARREAVRLHQLDRGHRYEGIEGYEPGIPDKRNAIAATDRMQDTHDRLQQLSERGRLTLFLHGAGYTHAEIADQFGVRTTRVQQLDTRARQQLRIIDRQKAEEDPDVSPEVKLLNELRRDPPVFIRRELGRCPQPSRKGGGEKRRLQWSRLAMRIVRYRVDRGIDDPYHALGPDQDQPDDQRRRQLREAIVGFGRGHRREPPGRGIDR